MRILFYYTGADGPARRARFAVAARGLAARGEPVTVVCRAGQRAEQAFAHEELEVVTAADHATSVSRDAWRLRDGAARNASSRSSSSTRSASSSSPARRCASPSAAR